MCPVSYHTTVLAVVAPPILPSRDLEWGDRYAGVYMPQHPFAEIAIFDIIFEAFAAFKSAQIWCF